MNEIDQLRAQLRECLLANNAKRMEILKLRTVFEVALQLETALSEGERAHRDVARMTAALQPEEGGEVMQTAGKDGTVRIIMDENIALKADIERLRAALERIGGINDNPSIYNEDIDAVIVAALQPKEGKK